MRIDPNYDEHSFGVLKILLRCKPRFSSHSDVPSTTSDHESEESDTDDDPFLSDGELAGSSPTSMRLYHPKPRVPVQRRATIPGATTRPTLSYNCLVSMIERTEQRSYNR